MKQLDTKILVIDDAKFSTAMIVKILKNQGYKNFTAINDSVAALSLVREQHFDIVISDWVMPEVNGIELTKEIRSVDEVNNQFTYVLMLTGKESDTALDEAFSAGVDDFAFKSDMTKQLPARIFAGARISANHNSVLQHNRRLSQAPAQSSSKIFDSGIGDQHFAQDSLYRHLLHTASRGGITTYIQIRIRDWPQEQGKRKKLQKELTSGLGQKIRKLVRPLDIVCQTSPESFVVIAQFERIKDCSAATFKRLVTGIKHTSFQTELGFQQVSVQLSACCIDNSGQVPTFSEVEASSSEMLDSATHEDDISVRLWHQDKRQIAPSH